MARESSNVAPVTRPELERKLAEIARQPGVGAPGEALPEPVEVALALADLISDDNGEIVLFNDSGLRSLVLHTDAAVVADGRAPAHVTAAGDDVSGFKFMTFDNGLTLYFEEGLHLVLTRGEAAAR
jgi:hypothetical protein